MKSDVAGEDKDWECCVMKREEKTYNSGRILKDGAGQGRGGRRKPM